MKIKNIKIENYRGIKEEQEIPLRDFSTLIGKNDSGKSIVIYAIASFLDKKYQISPEDFNDKTKPIKITAEFYDEDLKDKVIEYLNLTKEVGISEFIEDLQDDNTIVFQKIVNSPESRTFDKVNILIDNFDKEEFQTLYFKKSTEIDKIIKVNNIEIPVEGVGKNSIYEKVKYIKAFCKKQKTPKSKMFVEDVKKLHQILPGVEVFTADSAIAVDASFRSDSLNEIKSFFEKNKSLEDIEKDVVNELNKEAEGIKHYLQEYIKDIDSVEMAPEFLWNKVVSDLGIRLKCHNDNESHPLSHKGSGHRRLFMVARLRYLAEREENFNAIYLIEEPETYLHPSAQEDLISAFNNLAEENQVLISTHSPVFAGATDKSAIILTKKEGQSIYYSIKDFPDEKDFTGIIVEELGIKPNYNPVEVSKTLFVESSNDREFYNLVCKNVIHKSLLENPQVLVLAGGGNEIASIVNIEYFDRCGKELFMILDSDKHNTFDKIEEQKSLSYNFNSKPKGKAYLLKKSCMENYYHPRAIERFYELPGNSIPSFQDNENVKETLLKISETTGKQIKPKNNFNILEEMREDEWDEVVEEDLVTFLKEIID